MEHPMPPGTEVRHSWSESDRFVPRTFVRPLNRFMDTEASGGIALLAAAVVAIVWANSPWSTAYEQLWTTPLRIELGTLVVLDHLDLRHWVNDALMAIFFLVVGLEIKRELVHGELRDRRAAVLPAIAALGGMGVPALVYLAFNAGTPAADGWGVPMATDIAFAVGILSLLGRRVPVGAKVFLLTLAIADDVGAIVVIAVFYTGDLAAGWLAVAVLGLVATQVMKRVDIRSLAPYIMVGAIVWLAMLESGIHATLAGVVLGVMTPAWSFHDPNRFVTRARPLIDRVEAAYREEIEDRLTNNEVQYGEVALHDLHRLAIETVSPLERLEHRLSRWTAFVIVPVFALANAGVRLGGVSLGDVVGDPVVLGVALGLVLGKTVGITAATAVAVRLGWGRLPTGTTWRHVVGLAIVAGVGFTVSLFVTGLAFTDPAAADSAKIGILVASGLAGLGGYTWLRLTPSPSGGPATGAPQAASRTGPLTTGDPAEVGPAVERPPTGPAPVTGR
jgi:Na+:H+ antiporter, NhaA family